MQPSRSQPSLRRVCLAVLLALAIAVPLPAVLADELDVEEELPPAPHEEHLLPVTMGLQAALVGESQVELTFDARSLTFGVAQAFDFAFSSQLLVDAAPDLKLDTYVDPHFIQLPPQLPLHTPSILDTPMAEQAKKAAEQVVQDLKENGPSPVVVDPEDAWAYVDQLQPGLEWHGSDEISLANGTVLPGGGNGGGSATYQGNVVHPEVAGGIDMPTGGNTLSIDAGAGNGAAGSLRIWLKERGPHHVLVKYTVVGQDGALPFAFAAIDFWLDENGALQLGDMNAADPVQSFAIVQDPLPALPDTSAVKLGGVQAAACTDTFTVAFKTNNGGTVPATHQNKPLEGLQVNLQNLVGNTLQTLSTNDQGKVTFGVACASGPYQVQYRTTFADGGTRVEVTTNGGWTPYEGVSGPQNFVNGGSYTVNLNDQASAQANIHSAMVKEYRKVTAAGYPLSQVTVRWESGQAGPCPTACYTGGTINLNANVAHQWQETVMWHEYGHHVQNQVGSLLNTNYGNHCPGLCHMWDSASENEGATFQEAFANFMAAVMWDSGLIPPYGDFGNVNLNSYRHDDASDRWDNWGPLREGPVGAVLWQSYVANGKNLKDTLDVMHQGPAGITDFHRKWEAFPKPQLASLQSSMQGNHIPAYGDGAQATATASWGDAGDSFWAGTTIPTGTGKGVLTHDEHVLVDRADFFRFSAGSNTQITLSMTPESGQSFDLYLYNPSGAIQSQVVGASPGAVRSITYSVGTSPGTWAFEVREANNANGWASQGLYTYSLQVQVPNILTSTTIVTAPTSVAAGASYQVCWDVQGSGTISHSQIHWGTTTGSYPNGSPVMSGTAAASWCTNLVAPTSGGTVYMRSHAVGPNQNIQSAEKAIAVSGGGITGITLTSYPASVTAGNTATVCYTVQGLGQITHTHVHWGTATGSYPYGTTAQGGNAPQSFCSTLTAPSSPGTVYFKAHAIDAANNVKYSAEGAISVTGPGGINSVSIYSYPTSQVAPNTQFQVCWTVNGSSYLDHTNLHYGTQSGSYPYNTAQVQGQPGSWCQWLTSSSSAGTMYIVAHASNTGGSVLSAQVSVTVTNVQTLSNVYFTSYPGSVSAGSTFTVCWYVAGNSAVSHTQVHWGTSSGSHPNGSPIYTGNPNQQYCTGMTAPSSGTIYMVPHAQGPYNSLIGGQGSIAVTGSNQLTGIAFTSVPSSVQQGQSFSACWQVYGSGTVSHTQVHYSVGGGATQYTSPASGSAGSYCATLAAPMSSTWMDLAAHATGPNNDLLSGTATVQVTAPSGITGVSITSMPSSVNSGASYTVCWQVNGAGSISHTNLHWTSSATSGTSETPTSTGSAPGSWCQSLSAPSVSGGGHWINIKAHAQGASNTMYSNAYNIWVNAPGSITSIQFSSYPSSVAGGGQANVCWSVGGSGSISHTNLHHGTASGNYPYSTAVLGGNAPQGFCQSITAPSTGTMYMYAHADGPNNGMSTGQVSIPVSPGSGSGVTSVGIYQYPGSVPSNGNFQVCWSVYGSGAFSHNNLHWGPTVNDMSYSAGAGTGNAPSSWCQSMNGSGATGTWYFRAHVYDASFGDKWSNAVAITFY